VKDLDFTAFDTLVWRDAPVPCTIAGLLRSFGEFDAEPDNDLDDREFVFRRTFVHRGQGKGTTRVL
jgi:hypothetical protein